MPAFRSVVSVLVRELGDLSLHPQGRPCGRPPAAAVLGRQPTLATARRRCLPPLPTVRSLRPHACAYGWGVVAASCFAVMACDQARGSPCCGLSMACRGACMLG